MKLCKLWAVLAGIICSQPLWAASPYADHFLDKTMRVDYFHIGHAREEFITLDRIFAGGPWAGSTNRLTNAAPIGQYGVKVQAADSGELLFTTDFNAYFGEYQTTTAAGKGVRRTYHESVLIPYPKHKIQMVIECRDRRNVRREIFTQEIDPASTGIGPEPRSKDVKVFAPENVAPAHHAVDIAILAEGYTAGEEAKFARDVAKSRKILLEHEPYARYRKQINIFGLFKPSEDSGCSEPGYGSFKHTALGATFDSLGLDRYVLTEDNRAMRDLAGHVPYDTLVIMINHKRYGGGGIYNLYTTFTVDTPWHEYVLRHEFGHSFTGLADEYYTSITAYNDFYPAGIEPSEPNITALLNPQALKWSRLASPGVAIPTLWEKADYDQQDKAYQKTRQELNARIAALKREQAPPAQLAAVEAESERLSAEHNAKMGAYLARSKFAGKVGAFEGAGYAATGLYRPMLNCIMFTRSTQEYCLVCRDAVIRNMERLIE